jgi:hypothetical protein
MTTISSQWCTGEQGLNRCAAVRPIVSMSGSPTHGIGWWLDQQLKLIIKRLPSYIESSFDLKNWLGQLTYEPSSRISLTFTCNTVSMYTNINTYHTLTLFSIFLWTSLLCAGTCDMLLSSTALKLWYKIRSFSLVTLFGTKSEAP